MNMGTMSVWVCSVSVSRVCVVCYSTHHRVMSQARDDFEGFLKAHTTKEEKEEKVIGHCSRGDLTLCVENVSALSLLYPPSLTHSLAH